MNLIYSCIFFNEEYIELLDLLLKSFAIFGNCDENTKYLVNDTIEIIEGSCDKNYDGFKGWGIENWF